MKMEQRGGGIDFSVARVAGTVMTEGFLEREDFSGLPCDLVELRLDQMPDFERWIEAGRKIERAGKPVFATVRLLLEGGGWSGRDTDRLPIFDKVLKTLSGVDVELQSELAEGVARMAREQGKFCILSYHDFGATPLEAELEEIIARGQEIGTVMKVATMARAPEDVERLRGLLKRKWKAPLCLIAMGPLGRETRLNFPLEGSCLTYGYLDEPGAPGQYSAEELMRHLAPRRVSSSASA